MIPVSVSEIRSWHAQHRDEGDWRWCAIDRLLGELDELFGAAREHYEAFLALEDLRCSFDVTMAQHNAAVDRAEATLRRLGKHVDREENHG